MATDVLQPRNPGFRSPAFDLQNRLTNLAGGLLYGVILSAYVILFVVTLVTIGFVEIRQANMATFNALIATLEQRDANPSTKFDEILKTLRAGHPQYAELIASLPCPTSDAAPQNEPPASIGAAAVPAASDHKSCDQIKAEIIAHANSLFAAEDEILLRRANIDNYYVQFQDGIVQKSPQIIPALRLLDKQPSWVTAVTRAPFEIMEMFLLVCMGALGGVISVTRAFSKSMAERPSIWDLIYKPAAGGVIALGMYVLFRASQLFLTGQTPDGGASASTSIFLLAGLGLASGVCASDAIARIEELARGLLRPADRKNEPGADAATERR